MDREGPTPAPYDLKGLNQMGDQLDVPLEDSELLEEVEMVSTLMLAATENEEPLDQAAIDHILGIGPPEADEQRTARG